MNVTRLRSYKTTSRECIISCLPKGDKPREFLKNWRPISLLNVSYKITSAIIASRLQSVMDPLISNTQSGFLTDRYIGESTRLIYDIMQETEHNNIDGLLMLIDFEKAFDSISWRFLYKALKFFNFGEYICNWVKILNNLSKTISKIIVHETSKVHLLHQHTTKKTTKKF